MNILDDRPLSFSDWSDYAIAAAGRLVTERDLLLRQLPAEVRVEMDEKLQAVHGAARHAREVSFLQRKLKERVE